MAADRRRNAVPFFFSRSISAVAALAIPGTAGSQTIYCLAAVYFVAERRKPSGFVESSVLQPGGLGFIGLFGIGRLRCESQPDA